MAYFFLSYYQNDIEIELSNIWNKMLFLPTCIRYAMLHFDLLFNCMPLFTIKNQ